MLSNRDFCMEKLLAKGSHYSPVKKKKKKKKNEKLYY